METVSPPFEHGADFARSRSQSATELTFQILRQKGDHLAHAVEIRKLREATGQVLDVTTDPAWFVAKTIAEKRRPWLVLVRRSGSLVAVLQMAEKCFYSIPTGYLRGGDAFGQGFLIACPDSQEMLLRAGLEALFSRSRAQLLLLSLDGAKHNVTHALQPPGVQFAAKRRVAQYRLPLCLTVDATLKLFGSHTRRNLRYYLRKAMEDRWSFYPELKPGDGTAAVLELIACTTHPITVEEALRRLELMRGTFGAFAMGLRSPATDWLSYLAGWREGNRTFVFFQMNDASHSRSSVSTVMRAYLIQQEIERGTKEIVFLDGTSPMIARGCLEDTCVDVLLYRKNVRSFLVNRVFAGLLQDDHPLRMK